VDGKFLEELAQFLFQSASLYQQNALDNDFPVEARRFATQIIHQREKETSCPKQQ